HLGRKANCFEENNELLRMEMSHKEKENLRDKQNETLGEIEKRLVSSTRKLDTLQQQNMNMSRETRMELFEKMEYLTLTVEKSNSLREENENLKERLRSLESLVKVSCELQ
ncbi:unnamed protein product, partial [Porites lobata]